MDISPCLPGTILQCLIVEKGSDMLKLCLFFPLGHKLKQNYLEVWTWPGALGQEGPTLPQAVPIRLEMGCKDSRRLSAQQAQVLSGETRTTEQESRVYTSRQL